MNRRPGVLFVSAFQAPFVQDDIDFLSRHCAVTRRIGRGFFHAVRTMGSVAGVDVIFCWFASAYAFAAVAAGRLAGVPSVVVVGGVDVAREPGPGYGLWLNPWKARLARYVLRRADRVLAVDECLAREARERAAYDGRNISVLPTGYDALAWKPLGDKEPRVLTVAAASTPGRLQVKGIPVLAEVARRLPGIRFDCVGVDPSAASRLNAPSNLSLHPAVERSALLPLYRRAKVYFQPSLREGLPNAVCEAMLCGCIPVATDVGGTRSAVGDAGFLVPPGDVEAMASALERALGAGAGEGSRARSRIVALFPKERRESGLLRILGELCP